MTLQEKLFALQAEIKPMVKDTQGYNYKYFDINQMLAMLKPLFAKYKVLVQQPLHHDNGDSMLMTIIYDLESNSTVESSIALPKSMKPQELGSAITYYRRYSLQSLLLMEAKDDDAKSANDSVKDNDSPF